MSAHNEKGAILLTTLLVMSIMATVAVSLMDDVRFAIKRAANVDAYAQADWYVSGAESFAASYLENLLKTTDSKILNAALQDAEPVVLPIEGGAITLSIRDGSGCISLGGLTENEGRKLFRQLLESTGWDSLGAANLTSIAADWVDTDTQTLPGGAEDYVYLGRSPAYRAANTNFSSVSELRALSSMTEEAFQLLRPYVCARETAVSAVNIDTLHITQAPVLAAVLGGSAQLTAAQQILAERPAEGYETLERLNATPALTDAKIENDAGQFITFTPKFIWVEIEVAYRQVTRHAVMEFENNDGTLTRIFRRLSKDEARPAVVEDKT